MDGDTSKECSLLNSLVEIDGSVGEGGGEILRNCVAYSSILSRPIKVLNIRAGRPKPGLRPQHLQGILLARDICDAEVSGCCENSTQVQYNPGSLKGGQFLADTKTAGSVTLLLQTVLPCMLFASGRCSVTLKGGTNADMAPQVDFVLLVLKPVLEKFSISFHVDVITRGYFPKGGGEITVHADPVQEIQPIKITDRGRLVSIYGRCFVAGVLPLKIAHEMKSVLMQMFKKASISSELEVNIEAVKESQAFGNGCGIQLVASSDTGCLFSGSALGNRNLTNHDVASKAFEELMVSIRNSNCCVDKYLQDQLIIFMALAKGKSEIRCGPLTSHTKTAIEIAEKMTGVRFEVVQLQNATEFNISCHGLGLKNLALS